jgi:hypothetical protein
LPVIGRGEIVLGQEKMQNRAGAVVGFFCHLRMFALTGV